MNDRLPQTNVHHRKSVLVTGATGTLGAALTLQLAKSGYRVTGTFFQNTARAAELKANSSAELVRADLRLEGEVKALFELARPDAVVHCAGSGLNSLVMKTSKAHWRTCFETNTDTAFLVTREFLRSSPAGSKLVLVSSRVGERGSVGQSAYAAAKGAVTGLMRVAAAEGGPWGLEANAVFPGYIPSNLSDGMSEARLRDKLGENLIPGTGGLDIFLSLVEWLIESETTVNGRIFRPDCRI